VKHYLHTSVVVARFLEGFDGLSDLEGEQEVASSVLLRTEFSRVIHRGLQTNRLDVSEATRVRHGFERLVAGVGRILLAPQVLRRAEGPYPLVVRTLDALHLASAELWAGSDPLSSVAVWSLDERMNHCAAQLGFQTPLLELA